ncbi:MBL fold metallo-hydrolase [Synechococcus sp. Tobar12-5m-g]|jgi:hypothetical protein|uniref:MBL fold metallo-hydrolase n=1 Tax=unclassified Synechococcus TaxID=2626047 RepID=UPI0020CD9A13|nr:MULTISPECIES: MBL fold metallo-hydrolase [unclassified Synechococcus]MCP9771795.1 MBL fold metallo-hydrolase [Synechococcus sp. Tobar12-5m-g]MCP9872737.1 MBL fold metallo-hydrolase [Synechococcus sp. Cruz CV-v-12]
MALHATYFGANGWLLEFGSLRVLLDPWLTGTLEFPPGPWLFQGRLAQPWPVPQRLDLLLLSQGLPDHSHPASLELLEKSLPVVGSAAAAQRVQALGFSSVTALTPGQHHDFAGLRITATAGAPVPQVENGYLLEHAEGRLYVEPHGFLAPDLPAQPLDAVITPVVDLGLPLAGAFVKGRQVLPRLLERFEPLTVLASTAGGEADYTGLLTKLLWQEGTAAAAAALLTTPPLDRPSLPSDLPGASRFIDPVPGVRYSLAAKPTCLVAKAPE